MNLRRHESPWTASLPSSGSFWATVRSGARTRGQKHCGYKSRRTRIPRRNFESMGRSVILKNFATHSGAKRVSRWSEPMLVGCGEKRERQLVPKIVIGRAAVVIFSFCGCSGVPAHAQAAAAQVRAEIERCQRALKDKPITDSDFAPIATMAGDALRAASESAKARRLYLSLEQLEAGEDLLRGAQVGAQKAEVVRGGLTAFESKWRAANRMLTKLDQQAQARDWKGAPTVVRALSEAAQGRSLPLLEGGRGFAAATAPKDGLLYVGQSQGEAEFANFCVTLNLSNKELTPVLRSMLPELVALQQKTNTAFQPPRSIELHSRFIALNSALKLAQELDARTFYAGSLYQYLEAVRHYAMLDAPALDLVQQRALTDIIAAKQRE